LSVPLSIAIMIVAASMLASTIVFAHADNINPGLYSIDSKPYGISYAEWTAKWEQWLISMPQQINPAADRHISSNSSMNPHSFLNSYSSWTKP